jgi:hypothetical protein
MRNRLGFRPRMVGFLQLTWSITTSLALSANFVQVFCPGTLGSKLHLVCTHGMEPFEPWEDPGRNNRLLHWIGHAVAPPAANEPAVVRAYHLTKATKLHYPNTGEIVASLLARSELTGFISEFDHAKISSLRAAWSGTNVTPLQGSWRQHLGVVQSTLPERPWLFTMDPMSFYADPTQNLDDNRLYPFDLHARLVPVWKKFLATDQPGAIAIFSFELQRGPGTNRDQLFREHTSALARNLGLELAHLEVSYGNPHVGAILTNHPDLTNRLQTVWQRLLNP